MESAVPDDGIGELLVTSRSLAEYRAMFALSEADMRLGVLDCPGGASSATAEINAAGGNAFAVDPVYGRGLTATQLAQLTQADTNRGNAYVRAHSDLYRWTFFADADHHHRSRSQAGHRFARDYAENPDHYLAAELPHLPFSDRAFDLVLSSHLLFSYADRLTRGFHRETINELVRLARVEVRIFPLVAMGPVSYAPDELLPALHADGITARVVDVDYEFQAGGNQMLVCTPKGPKASRL